MLLEETLGFQNVIKPDKDQNHCYYNIYSIYSYIQQ